MCKGSSKVILPQRGKGGKVVVKIGSGTGGSWAYYEPMEDKMATKSITIAPKVFADLAAAVSNSQVTEGVNCLTALSEALWQKATEQAGSEVTALFSAHIEVEALIHWLEGCQSSWLSPEIARSDVKKSIQEALALFGEDLDKVLEPHLQEVGLQG